MTLIILALIAAPITLPLTARLALGNDEAEAVMIAMFIGLVPASVGALLAMGLVLS